MEDHKLWGGVQVSPLMERFYNSFRWDQRLWAEDLTVASAHTHALERAGILSNYEASKILGALSNIREEWSDQKFEKESTPGSICSANLNRLSEMVGQELAIRLRIGRSDDDSSALRLWTVRATGVLKLLLAEVVQILCSRAERELDILIPLYTHLHRAKVTRWSHWLLHHCWFIVQDHQRLTDFVSRIDKLTMESGSPYYFSPRQTADEIGFSKVARNNLNALGDCDFVAEFLFWCSLAGVHLSQLAEDLILFSTKEFGFVTIADGFCTKDHLRNDSKNPDGLELVRARAGSIIGMASGVACVIKGLPSSFNSDIREARKAMIEAYDSICLCLQVITGAMLTLTIDKEACHRALSPELLIGNVVGFLMWKGETSGLATETAKSLVQLSKDRNCELENLRPEEYLSLSKHFNEEFIKSLTYEKSIDNSKVMGNSSMPSLLNQISMLSKYMKYHS